MSVQLYYFDQCPSYRRALENLREALRLEGLSEAVELVAVVSDTDAQEKRFTGSPSIRINGIDLEGVAAEARGYGFGCRVYEHDGRPVGWPSVDQIRRVLQSLHKGGLR